jgi:site-specific recombinase XerC
LINWRAALHAFCGWLLRQKQIDFNPIASVAKPKVIREPPAIWTPDDLDKLLRGAPSELVPVITVGAFAGLRTSELLRLNWSEVNLARRLIEVTAVKAKSSRRRLVTIQHNLAQWLPPYAAAAGKVWPKSWRSRHEATAKLAASLSSTGRRMGCAIRTRATIWRISKVPKCSLSRWDILPRMIFEHYREVTSPQAAERYWEIRP